jgi:hypothetical protein
MKITKSFDTETYQKASGYYATLISFGFSSDEAVDIVFRYTGYTVRHSISELDVIAERFAAFFNGAVVNLHQPDDKMRSIFSMDRSDYSNIA